MKRLFALAALAFAAFAAGGPAEARTAPEGSYTSTCRNLTVDGDTLYGECRNSRGKWKKTWISGFQYCDGDIYNRDGVLDCDGGRLPESRSGAKPIPRAAQGDLPAGPWVESCRDAVVDSSVLRATCRDADGTWRPTWIDLRQCRGEIANDDGLLICIAARETPKPAVVQMRDTLPQGNWTDFCRSGAVKQFQMRAECFGGDQQWFVTDLDLRKCKSNSVSAVQGRLRCD
jgi:hypothetical protein